MGVGGEGGGGDEGGCSGGDASQTLLSRSPARWAMGIGLSWTGMVILIGAEVFATATSAPPWEIWTDWI